MDTHGDADYITQRNEEQANDADPMIINIDPVTGNDVQDYASHPSIEDGNVTIYFESEETKQTFLSLSARHTHRYFGNAGNL